MRVGIIGGGITGLALTHALARRGIDSILFEMSERLGGEIRTVSHEGQPVELGPQRIRLTAPLKRLVSEVGLDRELQLAKPGARLFIWADGRLRRVPTRPRDLFKGDLLSPLGKCRVALEPLTGGLRPGESAAGYFRRKVGREAYERLFGPLVSATFGADPAKVLAGRALPMILGPLGVERSLLQAARRRAPAETAPACTFRDGLAALPSAIAAQHEGRLRYPAKVEEIRRSGSRFALKYDGSCSSSEIVDEVVITTPAPAAGRLLRSVAPRAAEIVAGLRYNRVAVVPLKVRSAFEGFGFQVALGESLRIRGVTWNASLFDRAGICTAYLGGGLDPAAADWEPERLGAVAASEYEAIHGAAAEPIATAKPSLPAYDASWRALDGLEVPQGVTLAASYRGRLGIPGRVAEAEAVARRLAGRGQR